jgi:uncharacterized protein YbjQ (UPF0145 family)|tara:strand:- start:182 stop:574 length:393 start_codon:yes stop_codon:yes gene_type:complete
MKTKKLIWLIPLIFSTVGCASTWSYSTVDSIDGVPQKSYEATKQENITITSLDITNREYEVIGDISVSVNKTTVFNADPTREQINSKLKEKAASLGADAVILVRYGKGGIGLMTWGHLEGKGRAIKFIPD